MGMKAREGMMIKNRAMMTQCAKAKSGFGAEAKSVGRFGFVLFVVFSAIK
jgi:hypothetical protein